MKKQATYGDYVITIAANNSVSATYQGEVFDNTKAALREIADQAGFAYEKAWSTQQFGSKLVDFLNANSAQTPASKSEPNKSQKQHIRVEFEIDTQGNRIESEETEEDVTELLSKVFGSLAWLVADMDDEISEDEIKTILTVAHGFEAFDLELVRQRIMLEKMGIRDYNSHKALAASVPEEFRQMMFQALTMVAVSDFQLKQSELDLLAGLSDIWEMDEETTNLIVNDIVERFSTLHPERTMEVE